MSRSSPRKPLDWSQIGLLAMLGGLIVFGQLANGRTFSQALVALGVAVFVLWLICAWRVTIERARTAPPLTRGQRVWNLLVFLLWLGAMTALTWWFMADRFQGKQPSGVPALSDTILPLNHLDEAAMPEQPPPNAGAGR